MTQQDQSHALLDGRAWIPKSLLPAFEILRLKDDLTISLKPGPYDTEPPLVELFEETPTHFGIPRAYYAKTASGRIPLIENLSAPRRDMQAAIGPRDDQQREGIETIAGHLQRDGAQQCILQAETGVGKTVLGLILAARLKLATLVIVHVSDLTVQWRDEILGTGDGVGVIPGARVGIFQSKQEEFGDDYDIVIAMVQTLVNRDEDHPIFQWPGLVIVDECHRIGAPLFNQAIHRFSAAKRLGLTATPRRRDGGERLFFDALGDIEWAGMVPAMHCAVRTVLSPFHHDKTIPSSTELAWLVRDRTRNQIIVDELIAAVNADRHVLVITKRVAHVLLLKKEFERRCPDVPVGLCLGEYFVDEEDAMGYIRSKSRYLESLRDSYGNFDPDLLDPVKHKFKTSEEGVYRAVYRDCPAESWAELAPTIEEGQLLRLIPADGLDQPAVQLIVSRVHRSGGEISRIDFEDDTRFHPKSDFRHTVYSKVEPRRSSISSEQFEDSKRSGRVIFATPQKVEVGFNVPRLDTLILATPVTDPQQFAGRIKRYLPDKKQPVVAHVIDHKMRKFVGMWKACLRVYRDMGAAVEDI